MVLPDELCQDLDALVLEEDVGIPEVYRGFLKVGTDAKLKACRADRLGPAKRVAWENQGARGWCRSPVRAAYLRLIKKFAGRGARRRKEEVEFLGRLLVAG